MLHLHFLGILYLFRAYSFYIDYVFASLKYEELNTLRLHYNAVSAWLPNIFQV